MSQRPVPRSRALLAAAAVAAATVAALPAPAAVAQSGCPPWSPLACDQLPVGLPFALDWSADAGGLADGSGVGTGFRSTLPSSAGGAHQPAALAVDTAAGRLRVTAGSGTPYGAGGALDNALGVGLPTATEPLAITTTVVQPQAGAAKGERVGLWFGPGDDDFVSLVITSGGSTAGVQLLREVAGTTTSTSSPATTDVHSTTPQTLSTATVRLVLRTDPAARTVTGSYAVNGGTPRTVGRLTLPESFFDVTSRGSAGGATGFAGVLATRSASTAETTYGFDQFTAAVPTDVTAPPPAPAVETAGGDKRVGVTWEHAAVADRAGYDVYRSTSLPVPTTGPPLNASLLSGQTYSDGTKVVNGTTYHYAVVTVDTAGNRSEPVTAAPVRPAAAPAPTGTALTYATRAEAPLGRAEANGVAAHGRLYVFGGQHSGTSQTARSDRYDPVANTWTRIRDLPELITHAPAVVDGGTIWLLGGYLGATNKDSTARVWKYDVAADTYSRGPDLPAARGGGGAALVGRQLHFFTGAVRKDSTGAPTVDHGDHWVLDLDGAGTWASASPVPNPRNHVATAVLGGKVYLVGGQHGEHEATTPQKQVDVYDPVADSWTRAADLPVPRGHISASTFVSDGRIVTVGGSVLGASTGTASPHLFEYDPATDAWTTRTPLPDGRRSPVADLVAGTLVVNGGRGSSGPTTTTWTTSFGTAPSPSPTETTSPAPSPAPTETVGPSPSASPTVAPSPTETVAPSPSASPTVAPSPTAAPTPTASPAGWATAPAFPRAILDAAAAEVGGRMYVVAGKTSAGPQRTLYEYDPATRAWSRKKDLPGTAVENPAAISHGGFLYTFGGSTKPFSGSVAEVHRYDPATDTWSQLPPMATARGGPAAVVVNDTVHVVGGLTDSGASLATTEQLDLRTLTWSAGPALATPRDNGSAVVLGSAVHVFGGRHRLANGSSVNERLTTHEVLEPGAASWAAAPPLPTGRRALAAGALGGRAVAVGGERKPDGSTYAETEEYDPVGHQWRALQPMPTPRHGTAGAVLADGLHVVGGGTTGGSSYSAVHEVLAGPAGRDTTAPAAPQQLTGTASTVPAVELSWAAVPDGDVAGYEVHRSSVSPVSTSGNPVNGGELLRGTGFTDSGVVAGGTYYYTVLAVDSSGNRGPSAVEVRVDVPGASQDDVNVRVNFSDAATVPPAGYVRDHGQAYGPRSGEHQGAGLTYGWVALADGAPVDLSGNGRFRNTSAESDLRRKTFMHMQYSGRSGTSVPGAWELAVPVGDYLVSVGAGEVGEHFDSVHQVNVEDQNAVAQHRTDTEMPVSLRVKEAVRTVHVSDGRLTLSPHGGSNTKITHVEVRRVQAGSTRPRVGQLRPANVAANVVADTSVTADVVLTSAGGIDSDTVSSQSVVLRRVVDQVVIPAVTNTSGGGDVLVLTPSQRLESGVVYRFEVTDGVKDVGGQPFHPWSSVFTVGGVTGGTGISGVAFDKTATTATGQVFTSVTVGPDRKLYAATLDGLLARYPIAADGSLGMGQQIPTLTARDGARTIIGLAFAPGSTEQDLELYVTSNVVYVGAANIPDWTGKIVKLSGPNLERAQDVVVNLPRSIRDHETNSLAFGPDGALYVTQGSNTAMGAPDSAWGFRPERLLSAAVLRLDLAKLPALLPLNAKTEEGGAYDPYAPDAPLTIHATGVRNAYDLLWHSNGQLYVPTNGSAAGGNTPATPSDLPPSCANRQDGPYVGPAVPGLYPNKVTETDWVFKVRRGGYYGHPAPVRCEWVLNGGNPTAGADPWEVSSYPQGVAPDRNYRIEDVFDAGLHASANGVVEYQSDHFGGALKGKMVVVRYSAGQDLMVLDPSGADGRITSKVTGVQGMTGFSQPLDVAHDPVSGNLYVTELGGQRITRLVPRPAA